VMTKLCLFFATLAICGLVRAQTSYPPGYPPAASQPAATPPSAVSPSSNPGDLGAMLQRLEQETSGLNADVGKLRVEKWKTDSATKHQTSENIGSIQRNITGALPGLITAVRSTPQSLAANFKLYRNLNALYDVVASVGESAGAFGKREEYDLIARHAADLDEDRRNYGEFLQRMTASADDRIAAADREKAAIAAQPPPPPKRIIVDDNEPATPPKKKRTKKSSATGSAATGSTAGTSTPK